MHKLTTALALGLAIFTSSITAQPASAKIKIDINIGLGIGSFISGGRGIACRDGVRLLDRRGFNDIRVIDCRGNYYIYRAFRNRGFYEIAIRSRNGQVVDVRRLRR